MVRDNIDTVLLHTDHCRKMLIQNLKVFIKGPQERFYVINTKYS